MTALVHTDHRADPGAWARSLGISREAVDLYLDSEVVDLHNDVYVPARLYGYDVHRRHRPRLWRSAFFGHTDLPRLREARMGAVVLDIATNPLRRGSRRLPVTVRNIERIRADLARHPGDVRLVTRFSEYREARAAGAMACFIGIQGGQAFQHDDASIAAIPPEVHRITLVHLTNSRIGGTSSPLGRDRAGLSTRGVDLVRAMNEKRILVDLAHINRSGFVHAAEVHDRTQPLICTHTGVSGVYPHWRNIDDAQIRLVAETGGTIGIIVHGAFLGRGRGDPGTVVDHIAHVLSVAGDDHASIGTDYDGLIIPVRGLEEVTSLPRLVQAMLDRRIGAESIRKVLGSNALRVFEAIRP